MQELGLTPETRTVLVYTGVDSTDFATAARSYWTLKSLGVRDISILNGGLNAWRGAGLPVSNQPAQVARSNWRPRFNPRWLATRDGSEFFAVLNEALSAACGEAVQIDAFA